MRMIKLCAVLLLFLATVYLLGGCGLLPAKTEADKQAEDNLSAQIFDAVAPPVQAADDYIRAVWVSYLDLYDIVAGDEAQYAQKLDAMYDNLASIHTTDVYFQVRAFGESLYSSDVFTIKNKLFPDYNAGIDYLGLAIEKAHARGLRIHAWINPYRLGSASDTDTTAFCEPINQQSPGAISVWEDRMWIDPSNETVQALNLAYITELMSAYAFDGLHFDDYFYPTDDPVFDEYVYDRYAEGEGALPLDQWRRQNVLDFVKAVYATVKAARPDAVFGISPDASIDRNINRHYIDVRTICTEPGYVDYVCPQIYFGYDNQSMPFLQTITEWSNLTTTCDLIAGLSFYKTGATDAYAGSGENEWLENCDIISRQYLDSLEISNCKGIALFRYNSIFNPSEQVLAFAQLELYNYQKVC